jgi:uncharacterized protein YjiS (DUF1127 family)
MTDNDINAQTASLLAELRDPRMMSGLEVEAYARRLRARAIASAVIALGGLVKRGWVAFMAAPPVAERPAYNLSQLEADARYQRAEAFAEAIFQATKLVQRVLAPLTLRVKAFMAREAALAELYGLDERTLYDMGLSRSEIPAAVAGNIYRPHSPKLNVASATDTVANENRGVKIQVLGRKVVA